MIFYDFFGFFWKIFPVDKITRDIENFFDGHWDEEYLGVATHEQYFYSDYYAYQPDYPGKILTFAKSFYEHGFEFITSEQMK